MDVVMNVVGPPEHAVPGRAHPASTPCPRGPLTAGLLAGLRDPRRLPPPPSSVDLDPLALLVDDDVQLALYCINELAYRGFDDVEPDVEVHPTVHGWRLVLEDAFERALRDLTHDEVRRWRDDPVGQLDAVGTDDGYSLSQEVLEAGDLARFLEVLVHRSGYQLKEADPHSWAIPRLGGAAKAPLIEIQMDEYGSGEPGRSHAELFATTLRGAGLDDRYGAYLEHLPGVTLATTNLISLLGGRRRLVPALLGHLAMFENTSVGPMARWAAMCDRVGLPAEARAFYDVHVVADAHHGPLARDGLIGGLLAECPSAAPDVVFGAAAGGLVESLFADHLRLAWAAGGSSLRDA